ncbi:MAG: acetate--CoA ligase [Candidatus Hydrothermarchaeaceae archaeon]
MTKKVDDMNIEKPTNLKVKPNLPDYEAVYKTFRWEDAQGELEYRGGLNAAHEAIDRHAGTHGKRIAMYFESDSLPSQKYTFSDMKNHSNRFANVLTNLGVKKGDRVFMFLPRIPAIYISFLGTLKTGAIGSTLFAAFGTEALRDRLFDSGASAIVTDSELKKRVDGIKDQLPELKHIITVGGGRKGTGISYEAEMKRASDKFETVKTGRDDPAFMLYTSGTTGKPKGVIHTHKAILQQHMTAKWILDLHDDDIYWCTADPGWVTGVAYGILGSWSNRAASVVHHGRFDAERWYSILEKYRVSVWYTAPTAVRMLMKAGDDIPKRYDLSSLRHICSVGERLNPETIRWSQRVLGLPIHDNYWQTETGSIVITNYPSMPIKPGSMGKPIPGIKAAILDDDGKELPPGIEGSLALLSPWPSMMKAIWKNEERYNSYFMNGWYITGDRATVDRDGYFWFVGRADDIIKTAGERVGPYEVESVLMEHPAIVEAGVIGKPDPMRGEIIKAFIILKKGYSPSEDLIDDIKKFVKKRLAGHAYPREITFADSLPKTKSGKIVRRILKAKELGMPVDDVSTLEEAD